MNINSPTLFTASLLLAVLSASAQTTPYLNEAELVQRESAETAALCRNLVPSMIGTFSESEDLRPALAPRPIDLDSICGCAVETVVRENRLAKLLQSKRVIPPESTALVQNQMNSYIMLLNLRSLYACIAADMAKTLETSPLPE